MGNTEVKIVEASDSSNLGHSSTEDTSDKNDFRPVLSDQQKKLLQETWKILEEDIGKIGIIVFINLFEKHPDVQNLFSPLSGVLLENLMQSKQLRAHALRVMGAVQKAVSRLYEQEKLEAMFRQLGRNHIAYGANPNYLEHMVPQFLTAIRPSLEQHWTPEVHQAWNTLLVYLVNLMKEGMKQPTD